MERTEKDNTYFHFPNLLLAYGELSKDEIYPTLIRDLTYLKDNKLQHAYCDVYDFLANLKCYLNSGGNYLPPLLVEDILNPIEIKVHDVMRKIYNTYHS